MKILALSYDVHAVNSGSGRALAGLASLLGGTTCLPRIPSREEATHILGSEEPRWIISQQWATPKAFQLARELGVKFAMYVHGPKQYEQFFRPRDERIPDLVFCADAAECHRLLAYDRRVKAVHVPPVVLLELYRSELPPIPTYYLLVCSETYRENKGFALVECLARLMPEQPFAVVGEWTQKKGWPPNLRHIPPKADMRPVFRECKALVMPSKAESYGRAAIEALANGIPVLATDLATLRASTAGSPGAVFLRDREDAAAWKAALENLPEDREAIRRHAESHIAKQNAELRDRLSRLLSA